MVLVSRMVAVGTCIVLTAGLGIVLIGIVRNDPARAAGGACLTITTLTLIALTVIRRWITDTAAERTRHLDAARAAHDERVRYIAAQAALSVERDRMRRDSAVETARLKAQLAVEREALQDQFDAERGRLICESFQAGALMQESGALNAPSPSETGVIQFPRSAHVGVPAQARTREHISQQP